MNTSSVTTTVTTPCKAVNQINNKGAFACRPLKRKIVDEDQEEEPVLNKFENSIRNVVDKPPVLFLGRHESYPDELNKLIQPLACDLCRTRFNSLRSAKDHYESRAHDRSISNWLSKMFSDKGLEPPAVKRLIKEPSITSTKTHYCEACDLQLSSTAHANQHYSGRKHQLVIGGQCKPSGGGYYTKEGKWIRTSTKASALVNDGRFGIGEAFKTVTQDSKYCEICEIKVTSAPQLQKHLEGIRHRKKLSLAQNDGNLASEMGRLTDSCDKSTGKNCTDMDFSNYRTPNGTFYCSVCNICMAHVSVVRLHLQGKKHIKREKLVKSSETVSSS